MTPEEWGETLLSGVKSRGYGGEVGLHLCALDGEVLALLGRSGKPAAATAATQTPAKPAADTLAAPSPTTPSLSAPAL